MSPADDLEEFLGDYSDCHKVLVVYAIWKCLPSLFCECQERVLHGLYGDRDHAVKLLERGKRNDKEACDWELETLEVKFDRYAT